MIQDARIMYVNLKSKTVSIKTLDKEIYRKYPGGSLLGMYLIFKNMDPKVEALDPKNQLIFAVSPLTGLPISGQSRMNVTTKSPLTGTIADSQVGGYIAAAMKANGYDAIVFSGKSDTPVYLYVEKENIEIRDASTMWGKVTGETENLIIEDIGNSKIESSIIGPAGENLVKYASIMHRRSRANGRNGVGAVMGSKLLKAIVFKKVPGVKPENPKELKTLTLNVKERIEANPSVKGTALNGSAGVVEGHAKTGALPSYNWEKGTMSDWKKIGGETITSTILVKRETCYACAIACKGSVKIENRVLPEYGGPEYETCATFGSYCGNTDLGDLCEANQLCNMYGLDTISCGATIAWAMECFEKGILTLEDTDGLELRYGNGKHFAELIKKIATKEKGIGALLAEGSYSAAEKTGKGSMDLVVTCKKQEWPAHMVQFKPNLAINYAVNPFGADHQSSEHDPALMAPEDNQNWLWANMLEDFDRSEGYGILNNNKAKFAYATQKFYAMLDTLCLCQFAWGPSWQLYGPAELIEFCKYGIGWDTTIEELQEIGERRIVMMRIFNYINGFDRKDDKLPRKAFLPIIAADGQVLQFTEKQFEDALDFYYEYAGWDKKTGIPTQKTIKKLGLEWI